MSRQLQVGPLPQVEAYDLLIATLGFETRATYIPRLLEDKTERICGIDYAVHHVHSYERNLEYFQAHELVQEPTSAVRKRLTGLVQEVREALVARDDDRPPRVAVDISCMDRDRLAKIVLALTVDQDAAVDIHFFYSFAQFAPDLLGSEGTVLVNRPIEEMEGWPTDPDAGLVCVMSLGFESRLATAAIETLEPSRVIALLPLGEDERYDEVVQERNSDLLSQPSENVHVHDYRVGDPLRTILDLNATVESLSRRARVVIVPIGPKTFALAAILVGIAHPTNTTVWRMSADDGRTPEDRVPSGTVVGLRVLVNPAQTTRT
jgi:hypothetical protein